MVGNRSKHRAKLLAGMAALAVLLVLAPLALFAQGQAGLGNLNPRLVAVAKGPAGLKWIGGNAESPLMHPGLDCISCHNRGEGPLFQVAGTVYAEIDEQDDYFGVEGIVVQATDKAGKSLSLKTNKAGNFYSGRGSSLALPLTVKVFAGKAERDMESPAPSGNCASCHSAQGAHDAPGRIMKP
jgi:hypothetical protein